MDAPIDEAALLAALNQLHKAGFLTDDELKVKTHALPNNQKKIAEPQALTPKDLFDQIASTNTIDLHALQKLVFSLGEAIPDGAMKKLFHQIDQDEDGKIDFGQFEAWWASPDRETGSDDTTKLRLKSRWLLKSVAEKHRLLGKSAESVKDEKQDFKAHVHLKLGDIQALNRGVGLSYSTYFPLRGSAEKAKPVWFSRDKPAVVVSLSCRQAEGLDIVSEFQPLVTKINQVLQQEPDAPFSSVEASTHGRDYFDLAFILKQELITIANSIIEVIDIKEFHVKASTDTQNQSEVSVDVEASRNTAQILKDLDVPKELIDFINSCYSSKIDLCFRSFEQFQNAYPHFTKILPTRLLEFQTFKPEILEMITTYPSLRGVYQNFIKYFSTVNQIIFHCGPATMEVNFTYPGLFYRPFLGHLDFRVFLPSCLVVGWLF